MTQPLFLLTQRPPLRLAPRIIHLDKNNARLFQLIANSRTRLSSQKNKIKQKFPHDIFNTKKPNTAEVNGVAKTRPNMETIERKESFECTFGKGFPKFNHTQIPNFTESRTLTDMKKLRQECTQLYQDRLFERRHLPCIRSSSAISNSINNPIPPQTRNTNESHSQREDIKKGRLRVIKRCKLKKNALQRYEANALRKPLHDKLPIRDYFSGKPLIANNTKDTCSFPVNEDTSIEIKKKSRHKIILRSKPRTVSTDKQPSLDTSLMNFTFGKKLPPINH